MAFRAYSYSESGHISEGVHDLDLLEREKQLAYEFAQKNPCLPEPGPCPLCGCAGAKDFAVIGGASYYRCAGCWSLFVPVGGETISKYHAYAPLTEFRASGIYQETGRKKRMAVWNEQIFWIEFRSVRYLKPLADMSVIEIGGRYDGFRDMLGPKCASFQSCRLIAGAQGTADAVIYFTAITNEYSPKKALQDIHCHLNKNGLLFLSSRVSTGFDILTLKGNVGSIFPYDCTVVPSAEALEHILSETGYELLEMSTPGTLDMLYVTGNSSKLEQNDLFARYLVEKTDSSVKADFQRFLQKSMMSSHAQLVARKI